MMEGLDMNEIPQRQGAPSRVLRELIRTPLFRELLKLWLQEGPPGGGAQLARAALREDVEVALSVAGSAPRLLNYPLSVAGSAPRLLNYLADFILEALRQLSHFPAPVLRDFLAQMEEGVDTGKLAELEETAGRLAREILWDDSATVRALRRRLVEALNAALWASSETLDRLIAVPADDNPVPVADPQAAAEMVNSLLRALARAHANRPRFLAETASFVDREAARQASGVIVEAAAQVFPNILTGLAFALYRKYKSQVKIMIFALAAAVCAPLFWSSLRRSVRLKGGR